MSILSTSLQIVLAISGGNRFILQLDAKFAVAMTAIRKRFAAVVIRVERWRTRCLC